MVGVSVGVRYMSAMLVRLFVMLALVLSTLPAPAAAAPACHDEPAMTTGHAMPMDAAAPAPAPLPDQPVKMGKALCVGCIAPATLKVVRVAPPRLRVTAHGLPPMTAALAAAALTPEPPPPRA